MRDKTFKLKRHNKLDLGVTLKRLQIEELWEMS